MLVSERCVDSWKSDWQLWLDRRQIGRTTRLIGNSQSVAEFYRELGVPTEKLAVIPNAVEIPADPRADRDRMLAEFDIPPGSRVVGFAGRLAPQKRVKDLVWAIQLLKQLRDRVYLMLVGDGPERTNLLELARHMSCDHLVRFTGHRDDAARLIGLFNVFWLASDFEGMSNSIMEAMAAGVPVVASDIPPNRELVVDGQTGFLVKVGDCVGMAQFADRILADPALAERLGTAGRERMRTEFSVEQMVSRHVELYRQVLAPTDLPRPNEPPALRRRSLNDASSAEQTAGVKPAARQALLSPKERPMCGITGVAWTKNAAPVPDAVTWRMTDVIAHRGPDDAEIYQSFAGRRICAHGSAGAGGRCSARRAGGRVGVSAVIDYRPLHRATAAVERGRDGLDCLQRRNLQLPRAAA